MQPPTITGNQRGIKNPDSQPVNIRNPQNTTNGPQRHVMIRPSCRKGRELGLRSWSFYGNEHEFANWSPYEGPVANICHVIKEGNDFTPRGSYRTSRPLKVPV